MWIYKTTKGDLQPQSWHHGIIFTRHRPIIANKSDLALLVWQSEDELISPQTSLKGVTSFLCITNMDVLVHLLREPTAHRSLCSFIHHRDTWSMCTWRQASQARPEPPAPTIKQNYEVEHLQGNVGDTCNFMCMSLENGRIVWHALRSRRLGVCGSEWNWLKDKDQSQGQSLSQLGIERWDPNQCPEVNHPLKLLMNQIQTGWEGQVRQDGRKTWAGFFQWAGPHEEFSDLMLMLLVLLSDACLRVDKGWSPHNLVVRHAGNENKAGRAKIEEGACYHSNMLLNIGPHRNIDEKFPWVPRHLLSPITSSLCGGA